jgi:sporulation protein YlmC with PRC-barrel domain
MSKKAYAIAVAALLGATPIAFAAQPADHHAAGQSQGTIQPDQMLASKMIGSRVYDLQNRNIGKVRDLIVDRDGMIDFVIVDVSTFLRMGGKRVPVKLSDLKTNNHRLTLDVTKEQLQRMADYWVLDRSTGVGSSTSPVHGGKIGSGR